jgi:8-hydroxy-5-deazaflavin:NADPH oxidoreductase
MTVPCAALFAISRVHPRARRGHTRAMAPAKIGIIGAGGIGQAFAKQALAAGCEVILSNRRGPHSLHELVRSLGPGARNGTVREAARAPIVVVAVPWNHLREALADLPPWDNRIVVDTNNPISPSSFKVIDLAGRTSSEVFAELVPGARVVKLANTMRAELLGADPHVHGGRRVLFASGDDAAAKREVAQIFEVVGFAVLDLGPLIEGGRLQQFPGGALAAIDLIKIH